ncbi:MAG: thiol-disulfide oxidoreductase DCC family protein [Roseobacter sp.]
MRKENDQTTSVLYNAQCPVCSYEIDHYAKLSKEQALPIAFDDLNDPDRLARWNVDADAAARRLHVIKGDEMLTGIPAFIVLWQEMPRYRWLARVVGLPIVFQLACAVYDYVLAPVIYRSHLKRIRKAG